MSQHPWCDRTLLYGVHFTLCLTEEQFARVCKHLGVQADWSHSNHATTYFFDDKDGRNTAVVVVRDWEHRDLNAVLALIVHEATHVWQYACRIMGETSPGDEIEAYAMQNITQELFVLFDQLAGYA